MPTEDGYNYFVQIVKGKATDRVFKNKGSGAAAAKKAYKKGGKKTQTIELYKRGTKKHPQKGYRIYRYAVTGESTMVDAASIPWASKSSGKVKVFEKTATALKPAKYLAEIR